MNCAESIAAACAALLDEASRKPRPILVTDDHHLHLMSEAATGRTDQVCIAAFLPWDWAELDVRVLVDRYLAPLSARMTNRIPADFIPTDERMELPKGVDDTAQIHVGTTNVRVVIMEHAISNKPMTIDQARMKPWFNIDLDVMEHRAVLPLLRLDVRVKQKEPTP